MRTYWLLGSLACLLSVGSFGCSNSSDGSGSGGGSGTADNGAAGSGATAATTATTSDGSSAGVTGSDAAGTGTVDGTATMGTMETSGTTASGGKCDAVPFSLDMEAVGESSTIKAKLVDAAPAPPQRYENNWRIEFEDMDGNPLSDVQLMQARPFMPAHGHDGTYAPTVTALDDAGQFQVDRLNLWMPGMWEIQLTVDSPSVGSDYIVFNACIVD